MENERECGGCTACCKTHAVYEIQKRARLWCEHCQIGGGCKIYNDRPDGCKDFKCAWLTGTGLDKHRPDRIKIVPERRVTESGDVILYLWEVSQGSLETKLATRWTLNNLHKSVPVIHVLLNGGHKSYIPKGRETLDVKNLKIFPLESILEKALKPAK